VPDHVEDVAKQVWVAHRLFCEVLEFPDPLNSERYAGVACIEVCIRDRGELGGRNGAAYDESQRARRIPEESRTTAPSSWLLAAMWWPRKICRRRTSCFT